MRVWRHHKAEPGRNYLNFYAHEETNQVTRRSIWIFFLNTPPPSFPSSSCGTSTIWKVFLSEKNIASYFYLRRRRQVLEWWELLLFLLLGGAVLSGHNIAIGICTTKLWLHKFTSGWDDFEVEFTPARNQPFSIYLTLALWIHVGVGSRFQIEWVVTLLPIKKFFGVKPLTWKYGCFKKSCFGHRS